MWAVTFPLFPISKTFQDLNKAKQFHDKIVINFSMNDSKSINEKVLNHINLIGKFKPCLFYITKYLYESIENTNTFDYHNNYEIGIIITTILT